MGIKLLNTFLDAQNVRGIQKKSHFTNLRRKTLCIDISIYLYRFKQKAVEEIDESGNFLKDPQEVLLENIENMIILFRQYECELYICFDGKSPKEKETTIIERRQTRENAKQKTNIYQKMLEQRKDSLNAKDIAMLREKMISEIQKSISITRKDIEMVKNILDENRVKWVQCEGEADVECNRMVKKNQAWGVMSDDTDFIASGCKRIIRNVDFKKQCYDMIIVNFVLRDLKICEYDFRCLCVLAGCDYFKLDKQINIFVLYDYYCKYIKYCKQRSTRGENIVFLNWLLRFIDYNIKDVQNIVENHFS